MANQLEDFDWDLTFDCEATNRTYEDLPKKYDCDVHGWGHGGEIETEIEGITEFRVSDQSLDTNVDIFHKLKHGNPEIRVEIDGEMDCLFDRSYGGPIVYCPKNLI